jgi:predicted HAD superfamily phosphohydrolase
MKIRIVKEADSTPYVDLSTAKIGQKRSGEVATTTLTDIDPETGRLTWDVKYNVRPEELYKKLDELVNFLKRAPGNSELGKIRDEIRSIKNKTRRLITQNKS